MRLRLDASTRLLAGGTVLLGGHPARLVRLTPAGARLVHDWRDGTAVGEGPGARRLAARLVEAGLAHPAPGDPPGPVTPAVAVVVPARDRPELLAACLARIGRSGAGRGPVTEVVVVDDGSRRPEAVAAAASEAGARLVAHPHPRGPAAARNAGIAATTAPVIAFLDSDTRPAAGWLAPLLGHLAEPGVGAVAPRVHVPTASGAGAPSPLAAYEAVRSPLDLGPEPALVGPGRRVAFVPAAALVVRRAALTDVGGGFDPAMRVGEDVDLVWRLVAGGWTVRYEPAAHVEHPCRAGLGDWVRQRVAYGSSAGPLARRHPGRLRHLVITPWSLPAWGLALAGHKRAALVAAAASTAAVAARLPDVPGARGELVAVVAEAQLRLARQALDAVWRAYPPLAAAAALALPCTRRPLAAGLAAAVAADWLALRPHLDPLRFAGLRAADDLAYATGVWLGCLRSRTAAPLVPGSVGRG